MAWSYGLVGIVAAGCATGGHVCPSGAQLADKHRATGRVEFCAASTATAVPPIEHTYEAAITAARPPVVSGLHGPYTHWYPSGGLESHGSYVHDAASATSVPDGPWAFWYPDGRRRKLGTFARGRPIGCVATWDDRGARTTGVVVQDELRAFPCEPLGGDAFDEVEARSQPVARRTTRWGDVALVAGAQGGPFGARGALQDEPDPRSRAAVEVAVRKHLGRVRVGGTLGARLADTLEGVAWGVNLTGAYELPVIPRRLGLELEGRLGLQYFDITARKYTTLGGTAEVGFFTPLLGARAALVVPLGTNTSLVGGVRLEATPPREQDLGLRYCGGGCGEPLVERWTIGGVSYGADLGLRFSIR